MGKWYWLASIGAAIGGALAFLRIISNELAMLDQELNSYERKQKANRQHEQTDEPVEVIPVEEESPPAA